MNDHFDAIVIGAGQAGPSLAARLSKAGMRVAVIERNLLGGTCVNTGCMPTKTLVASAYAAHIARRASDFGIVIDGEIRVDFTRVQARAREVTVNARNNLQKWLDGMQGCELIHGHARFESPTSIRVGDRLLTGQKIFINVGARAAVPALDGVQSVPTLNNSSILELSTLPEHLVVIGGSYIGLEYAQMYRRFGARVTIVEKSAHLVSREDTDVSEAIEQFLVKEGIAIRTHAECIRLAPHKNGVTVGVNCRSGEPEVVGSHALLAVGRRPNTQDLGLSEAGVRIDSRGYIEVDDSLATNVPGIWALGDCNGRGAFTHTSYNDFEIVAANLLESANRRVSDRIQAYALYTDPPLGRVGMTLAQARATKRPLLVGTRPMTRVGRAIEKSETHGLMRVIVDAQSHKILGATILGPGGDEAIHGIIDMMNADAAYPLLQWSVPIHPTVSELIPTLLNELELIE